MVKGVGVGEGSIPGHHGPQEGVEFPDKKVVAHLEHGLTVGLESHSMTRRRHLTNLMNQLS